MELHNPSEIVKNLSFGGDARDKIMIGVDKLANAVQSTLGASGKCVIYEDTIGNPCNNKRRCNCGRISNIDGRS